MSLRTSHTLCNVQLKNGKGRQFARFTSHAHPPERSAHWVMFLRARPPHHWSRSTRASLIAAAITARTLHAMGVSASLFYCRPCTLHRTPTSQEAPIPSDERLPVSRRSSLPSSSPSSFVSHPATPTIAQCTWPFFFTSCSC